MRTARRSALPLMAVSAVVVALVACCVGGVDFLLLIAGHVLRPVDVSLVMWSSGVLTSAVVLARIVLRRRDRGADGSVGQAVLGGLLALTLVGTGGWCIGRAAVITGLDALGPDAYTVLRSTAGARCALVAHESTALRWSSGRLYAAGAWGYARPVGTWSTDEIELPVRDGTYSLRWVGGLGALSLRGSRASMPDRLRFSCPQEPSGFVRRGPVQEP